MYKHILLPLDGSELAEQAIPHAIAQARCFQAELILFQVLELLPKDRRLSGTIVKEGFAITDKLARQYLGRVAVNLQEQNCAVQIITTEGRPHAEIIKYAENNRVDLIVVSSRGQSGISRWLMGSVADRVVRGASIPVLVVHAHDE